MKQLVVNADDFGMSAGINRAIVESHRNGIVTSASLLANGDAFDDAVAAIHQCPGLSVGLHVNLTQGRPVGESTKSLVDSNGRFYGPLAMAIRLSIGAVATRDLEAEISAQAHRAVRAGIMLSHFDSHHHIHLHPRAASALAKVAGQMNVPWIRFRDQRPILPWMLREAGLLRPRDHLRHLVAMLGAKQAAASDENRRAQRFIVGAPQLLSASPRQIFGALVRSPEDGITEWVCHPGYADDELRKFLLPAAAEQREAELKVLTDPDCKAGLETAGIKLVGYADLDT